MKAHPCLLSSVLVPMECIGVHWIVNVLIYVLQELGVNILEDLSRQRETILRSKDTLHGADDGLSRARRVLGSMSRRVLTNKIIMICIALIILIAIILIVYYKFAK